MIDEQTQLRVLRKDAPFERNLRTTSPVGEHLRARYPPVWGSLMTA
jgi:hypothetical protein